MPPVVLDQLFGGLLLLLIGAAVYLFVQIQLYMSDPRRKERDEEWFKQFEAYVAGRYRVNGSSWRIHALEDHFHGQPRGM